MGDVKCAVVAGNRKPSPSQFRIPLPELVTGLQSAVGRLSRKGGEFSPFLFGRLGFEHGGRFQASVVHVMARERLRCVLYVSQWFPSQNADSFIVVSGFLHFSSFLLNSSPDHGFCDECMRKWLESNRAEPQRRLKQLYCPTGRKPARESDLGRMFVETVVLDEDTEYQALLVNAITE